jgi:hypothetical protein
MGEGVNIAARLEGIAQPGAICLSEDAYRQVRARLDLKVHDLGQTQLKNIVEPVRVYSLQVGPLAQAKAASLVEPATQEKPAQRLALPDKPSIAVLPFQNMSGDPECLSNSTLTSPSVVSFISSAMMIGRGKGCDQFGAGKRRTPPQRTRYT